MNIQNKHSTKRLFLVCWAIMLIVLLIGCSPAPKNEKCIVNDLAENESFLQRMELEIVNCNITKRQTTKDDWFCFSLDEDFEGYIVENKEYSY